MSIVVQWEIIKWLNGLISLFCVLLVLITWFNAFVLELPFTTKKIGYFSCFGIIFFTISSIANTLMRVISGYTEQNKVIHWIPSVIYSSTWCFGQIFVYLLFLERLKYSFKNTKYSSPSKYYYPFYIGIILFFLSSVTFQVTRILHETNIITSYLFIHSGEVRDMSQQIIDFILSIALLYIFNKKLWILSMDLSNYNSTMNIESTLNFRQESIIKIAVRLTLISSFAIISTQLLMIYTTIIYELCIYTKCNNNKLLYYLPIADVFWCLDCLINCLCIFMSYDFITAKNTYYYICYWCDYKCIKCCNNIAAQKFLNTKQNHYIPMPMTPSNITRSDSKNNSIQNTIQKESYDKEITDLQL
eukprot:354406_1